MDASTIGALVVARNRLLARSRSLTVRAPSSAARRLLELCGLDRLIDVDQTAAPLPGAAALGSWVAVPAGVDQRLDTSSGAAAPSLETDVPVEAAAPIETAPSLETDVPLETAAPMQSDEPALVVVRRHVEHEGSAPQRRVRQ
jgi:hypothetical protein